MLLDLIAQATVGMLTDPATTGAAIYAATCVTLAGILAAF